MALFVLSDAQFRWTAYDVKYFRLDVPDEVVMIAQQRAYTSPIWYTP